MGGPKDYPDEDELARCPRCGRVMYVGKCCFPAKPQPISGPEYFKAKREEIMRRFSKTLSYLAKH